MAPFEGQQSEHRRHSDRAQTAQDFALGIGFFIVAVAFVFAFVPSMLTFTTADPGVKASSQADRASTSLIQNLSTGDRPNELEGVRTAAFFNASANESDLQDDLALPNTSFINVTVRTLDGAKIVDVPDGDGNDVRLAGGREYPTRQPAAEVSRIVTITDNGGACEAACQLIVRVW